MKKSLILLIILSICLFSCAEHREYLPPGYKILCSNDGKFIAQMPYGTRLYKFGYKYIPYSKYQDAVDRAWELYEFIHPPSDTVKWEECKSS